MQVVVADSSPGMLEQAKAKLAARKDGGWLFTCVRADTTKLPFPDHHFDCVVQTFGLCSVDDPVAALKEMQRVCKPGGKVLLLEHGRSSWLDWLSSKLDDSADAHRAKWGCTWNKPIAEYLVQSGLQLDTNTTWHFGTTYYVVARPAPARPEPHEEDEPAA